MLSCPVEAENLHSVQIMFRFIGLDPMALVEFDASSIFSGQVVNWSST